MQLRTAAVDRYGPLADWDPPCGDGITVLSGPNEAGKTLYLEALLQLLEPAVAETMSPPPRVEQPPTGRVVLRYRGESHELGADRTLTDVCPIEPSHLRTVFVVRDSDLRLPSGQSYYTSLVDTLGDIHTTEIDAITDALTERGRLTPRTRSISSDRRHDDAGEIRDAARELAADIREYLSTVEARGLDELETSRLRCKRQLQESRDRLRALDAAEQVQEHDRLAEQLETYRRTSAAIEEHDAFDRETLAELREWEAERSHARDRARALATEIDSLEASLDEETERVRTAERRKESLERRQDAVEAAESALASYRELENRTAGADSRLPLVRAMAAASFLGAGAAGFGGAVTGAEPAFAVAVLLLVVGLAGGIVHYRTGRRLAALERSRKLAVRSARDAGFSVETVDDIGPAIEAFERELRTERERSARAAQDRDATAERLAELREERTALEERIHTVVGRVEECLETAGVEDVAAYAAGVERREELETERTAARQSLVDRFCDPESDDRDATIEKWGRQVAGLLDGIDPDAVDVEYDEATARRVEARIESLSEELESLESELDAFEDRLDAFDRRAREIDTEPFVGHGIELDSRSIAGLEDLADDLAAVVEAIERDAELSRKAIELFERIRSREEEKLSTLFVPDGPASRTLERITDGRYVAVTYDAAAHEIVVEKRDGTVVAPERLSGGTRDQLYFASRVSLASQLLGGEPGFLLLDDPFLAADPDRLARGFDALETLAAEGWQVFYLTAKGEITSGIAPERGLETVDLQPVTGAAAPHE